MSYIEDKDTFFASQVIIDKINNKYLDSNTSFLTLEINKINHSIDIIRKSLNGFYIELLIDSSSISDVILENFDNVKIKSLNKVLKEISINNYNLEYKMIKSTNVYKVSLKFKLRKEN